MRDILELAAIIDRLDGSPDVLSPRSEDVQELESVLAELMEAAYTSKNDNEKAMLSILELRARAVRERWIKGGRN